MGNLSFKLKVIILCAVVLVCSAAKQSYFLNETKLSWDEARSHCQMCYTDLVTLNSGNIHHVQAKAQNLTSACWVGLRKNFTSSNSSVLWSRWANGDPLLFQNWYPGWPVFKSVNTDCCSSLAATFTTEATDFDNQTMITSTDLWNPTTEGPAFNTTTAAPEEKCPPPSADAEEQFIEDSCVAMLSFGAWVEKNCLECLPYICYEEVLSDKANFITSTSESATIDWQPPTRNISHYFIEIQGHNQSQRENKTDGPPYVLVDLTPGTHYSVQVFPLKCDRNLSALEVQFYTKPKKVKNLNVSKVTETSVFLSWNKPDGRVESYLIRDQNGTETETESTKDSIEVGGLIPGNHYTFTVISSVNQSILSEEANTTTYTKPGKVSDLRVFNNTVDTLCLSWKSPDGKVSDFLVEALSDSNVVLPHEVTFLNPTTAKLTELPVGSRITISVKARVGGNVVGEKETVVNYTAPRPISNLVLETTAKTLNASWKAPEGTSTTFNVYLWLDGNRENCTLNLTETTMTFYKLKAAAKYTVVVKSFSGHLEGEAVEESKFTELLPPTNPEVVRWNKSSITFNWTAPENTAAVTYTVSINSSFWNYNFNNTGITGTEFTFKNLSSGSKYDFDVKTEAAGQSSSPTPPLSQCTDAEKREVSLSMLCSSSEPLLCDEQHTRDDVFKQLKAHLTQTFGEYVFWELEKQEN